MNDKLMNLLEPITYDNIQELKSGEWIWDDKEQTRRPHNNPLSEETIAEPTGFRQIHIMYEDDVKQFKAYGTPSFMLSTIDKDRTNYEWPYFEEGRFYRFKDLHTDKED